MIWSDAVTELTRQNSGFVLVTVLSVEGSSPRAQQTKMVVTKDSIFDSVGGGKLEFEAIQTARSMLGENDAAIKRREFKLGADLTQCCGGNVELLFEHFPACDFNIVLFGAGHVGTALISILSGLPCRVRWVDSRQDYLQSANDLVGSSGKIVVADMQNAYQAVEDCAPGSWYLIMTHSHEVDFELCEAILGRDDIKYCGLIGSKSKSASFRGRLKRKGYSETEIGRLTSPVGIPLGAGKTPMEVAVSVSAQLLKLYYESAGNRRERHSQPFRVVGEGATDA